MQTYKGSCHCGAVRFEIEGQIDGVMSCNCSHCSRKGVLLTFVPRDKFKLLSGAESLTEYRFNKHVIAHQFCKTCGVQSFAYGKRPDGSPIAAINTRTLEDFEFDKLPVKHVDGKRF